MSERVGEYSSPEARAHEPSVRINDGWAAMPVEQWVAYANLSNGFFQALLHIAAQPDSPGAAEYMRTAARAALPSHLTDLGQEDR